MPARKRLAVMPAVGLLLLPYATAAAQADLKQPLTPSIPLTVDAAPGESETTEPVRSDFSIDLTVYFWLTSLSGNQTVGDTTTSTDECFTEVLKESDSVGAFTGRIDLRWKRFGLFIDGMYSRLGVDDVPGGVLGPIDVVSDMSFVDFGLSYRLAEWDLDAGRQAAVTVYSGGRFAHVGLKLDPDDSGSLDSTHDWIDPIVGAGMTYDLSPTTHFNIHGDVGGFGVSADLTWSAEAVLGFDTHLGSAPVTLFLGYRALSEDFEEGSGAGRFGFDTIVHGPVLGASFRF